MSEKRQVITEITIERIRPRFFSRKSIEDKMGLIECIAEMAQKDTEDRKWLELLFEIAERKGLKRTLRDEALHRLVKFCGSFSGHHSDDMKRAAKLAVEHIRRSHDRHNKRCHITHYAGVMYSFHRVVDLWTIVIIKGDPGPCLGLGTPDKLDEKEFNRRRYELGLGPHDNI